MQQNLIKLKKKVDNNIYKELKHFQYVWIQIYVVLHLYKQIVSAAPKTIIKHNKNICKNADTWCMICHHSIQGYIEKYCSTTYVKYWVQLLRSVKISYT